MGEQKRGIFSTPEEKWALEYFRKIGMILRLRQNLKLFQNFFWGIEIGLRIFLLEEKKEEKLDL